jgi:hypothetical protein
MEIICMEQVIIVEVVQGKNTLKQRSARKIGRKYAYNRQHKIGGRWSVGWDVRTNLPVPVERRGNIMSVLTMQKINK